MVQLGSRLPFAQAAELMGRFWKVEVSEATVRRATEKSGQAYVEVQREEVAALEQEMQEAPLGPALQQLSVDGAMVPLLHGEWGEVKTLAIGTIEQSGPEREAHARDMSYFSRMLDHGRFGWLATVETHRRGTGNAGTVCAVVDGAEWQQKFIDLTVRRRCAFWTGVTLPSTWPGPVRPLLAAGPGRPASGWEDNSMS